MITALWNASDQAYFTVYWLHTHIHIYTHIQCIHIYKSASDYFIVYWLHTHIHIYNTYVQCIHLQVSIRWSNVARLYLVESRQNVRKFLPSISRKGQETSTAPVSIDCCVISAEDTELPASSKKQISLMKRIRTRRAKKSNTGGLISYISWSNQQLGDQRVNGRRQLQMRHPRGYSVISANKQEATDDRLQRAPSAPSGVTKCAIVCLVSPRMQFRNTFAMACR